MFPLAEPPYGPREVLDLDLQGLRDLFCLLGRLGEVIECLPTCYDLDTVEVGAVLPVGEYLESPDFGGAAHVRPAAQLARESVDLDHAHQVGVLLPEEHHRAKVAGLLERGRKISDRLVLG